MGVRERQLAVRAMRGQMWSPGRPSTARHEDRVRFWEAIARGASTEDAAVEAGVSSAVGARWFRQAGGRLVSDLRRGERRRRGPLGECVTLICAVRSLSVISAGWVSMVRHRRRTPKRCMHQTETPSGSAFAIGCHSLTGSRAHQSPLGHRAWTLV